MSEDTEKRDNPVFVLHREAGGEPFVFEWDGGKYEIPHVRDMDVFGVQEKISEAVNEDDLIFALFSDGMGVRDWAKLKKSGMNQQTFATLVTAWRRHCGLVTGESSALPE